MLNQGCLELLRCVDTPKQPLQHLARSLLLQFSNSSAVSSDTNHVAHHGLDVFAA